MSRLICVYLVNPKSQWCSGKLGDYVVLFISFYWDEDTLLIIDAIDIFMSSFEAESFFTQRLYYQNIPKSYDQLCW